MKCVALSMAIVSSRDEMRAKRVRWDGGVVRGKGVQEKGKHCGTWSGWGVDDLIEILVGG